MNAIKFEATVDESVAGALPELRPLLGRRVEMIALDTMPFVKAAEPAALAFDDFLAHRLKRPAGVETVTLEDMEQAIARGARGDDL